MESAKLIAMLHFRRWMALLILLPLASGSMFARARVSGYCEQGGQVVVTSAVQSVTKVQQSYPACSLTVYYTGGAIGTVNTSGTAVTRVSGNAFGNWAGLTVTINAVPYVVASVTDIDHLTLTGSAGPQTYVSLLAAVPTPVPIYVDNNNTPQSNPFTASSTGYWFFYADNGVVDVRMNGGGIPAPFTWGAISVIDPSSINNLPPGMVSPITYGADPTGRIVSGGAFATAVATGLNVYIPPGNYCLDKLPLRPSIGQVISGAGQSTVLWKCVDAPVFNIQGSQSQLDHLTIHGGYTPIGNYAPFTNNTLGITFTAPSSLPSFTDTTDLIDIGTQGVPFNTSQTALRNLYLTNSARDAIHYFDGRGPVWDNIWCGTTARSCLYTEQISYNGGNSVDTDEEWSNHFDTQSACLSAAYNPCSSVYPQGGIISFAFLKSFGSMGNGITLQNSQSQIGVWDELQFSANSNVASWFTSTTYTAGSFVKHSTIIGGTLTTAQGSTLVTGSGTSFSTSVVPGETITIGNFTGTVTTITSDTSLTLTLPWPGPTAIGQSASVARLYVTLAGGSGGTSAPTCNTGTCSDGGTTWIYRQAVGISVNNTPIGDFTHCGTSFSSYCFNNNDIYIRHIDNGAGLLVSNSTYNHVHGRLGNNPNGLESDIYQDYTILTTSPSHSTQNNRLTSSDPFFAFGTLSGNTSGFIGQENKLSIPQYRQWTGYHQPFNEDGGASVHPEAFFGSPDNIRVGLRQNGNLRLWVESGSGTVTLRQPSTSVPGLSILPFTSGGIFTSVFAVDAWNIAQDAGATGVKDLSFVGPATTSLKLLASSGLVNAPVGFMETLTTPASSSAPCIAGQFGDDSNYHYVCIGTNTWKRVALSSF